VSYIVRNPGIVLGLAMQHLGMTSVALLIATAIALPLGLLVARRRHLATPILGALGILYTIPSIALMILFIPIFGLNATSVVAALVIYSQAILVRNVVAGLQAIDPAILEAARGMGMDGWQVWWRVELPLALPVILAGMRVAAVVSIGIATVGALFSAGGLGTLLFQGIAQAGRYDKIGAGALAVGALAFAANGVLSALERAWRVEARVARQSRRAAAPPAVGLADAR
jgi:osmoprotectant transport system permease protein